MKTAVLGLQCMLPQQQNLEPSKRPFLTVQLITSIAYAVRSCHSKMLQTLAQDLMLPAHHLSYANCPSL